MQAGVGHYGVFNGRRWTTRSIRGCVSSSIRTNSRVGEPKQCVFGHDSKLLR